MNKEKDTLFYPRNIQKRLYFPNNGFVHSLFYLEKYLFDNFNLNEDAPISYIKQKWIYDCIEKNEFSNEVSKNLECLGSKSKDKTLSLINSFSQISNINQVDKFFKIFKEFNKIFNNLLKYEGNFSFNTSVYFQFVILIYSKKYKMNDSLKKKIKSDKKSIDIFELAFLELFLKNFNYKISKISYLYNVLLKFIFSK